MHAFNTQPDALIAGPTLRPPAKPRRPWLRLASPPPNITFVDLALLHRSQIHGAVAKIIGGPKGGYFAASLAVDLGLDPKRQQAVEHLILATTRYRGPYKWADRIDIAAVPCSDKMAEYYRTPVSREVAQWAFDQHAATAPYRVVLDKFGLVEAHKHWCSNEEWEFGR